MKKIFSFFALLFGLVSAIAQTSVTHLLTENRVNPLGIDIRQPRLSWQLETPARNVKQVAYEIMLTPAVNGVADWKSATWKTEKTTTEFIGARSL